MAWNFWKSIKNDDKEIEKLERMAERREAKKLSKWLKRFNREGCFWDKEDKRDSKFYDKADKF
jgi:hypothetical protein